MSRAIILSAAKRNEFKMFKSESLASIRSAIIGDGLSILKQLIEEYKSH